MNDEASSITYHRANNPGAYRALMPVENFVPCAKTLKVLRKVLSGSLEVTWSGYQS